MRLQGLTGCASAVPPTIERESIIADTAVKIGAISLTRSGIGCMRVFGGNAGFTPQFKYLSPIQMERVEAWTGYCLNMALDTRLVRLGFAYILVGYRHHHLAQKQTIRQFSNTLYRRNAQ
jgi:hypothetical protein